MFVDAVFQAAAMENNGFARSEGDIPLPTKDTVSPPTENTVDVENASEPRVNAFPVTVELAECVVMKKSDVLRFSKHPSWIRIRTAFQVGCGLKLAVHESHYDNTAI